MDEDVNSNSRGSLLKEMTVETDSDVPEFSLPPKSVVKRPKKSIRKRTRSRWRKFCRNCCRYCSGVLLALILCACVLSIALLFWFSLRLYRDVENLSRRLTIEVNRVQTEQITNVEKCMSLETKLKENMQLLQSGQKDIQDFKRQLKFSYTKIAVLNGTLMRLSHILRGPKSKLSLTNTVNALKKGMADTGAEITKLSDDIKQIEDQTSLQSKAIRRIIFGLYNVTSEVANVTGNSPKIYHDKEGFLQQKFQDDNDSNENNPLVSSLKKSNVYDVIYALNSSLSEQVKHLRTETELLKMKTSSPNNTEDDINISGEVTKVPSDMSAIRQLITKLNTQVGNFTHLSKNSRHITENSNEIRLLWQELELQNETIVQIQEVIHQNLEYKFGIHSRRRAETENTQDSSEENDFEIFPEGKDRVTTPSEQRRDTRFQNLESTSEGKFSAQKFDDLIEDNIT